MSVRVEYSCDRSDCEAVAVVGIDAWDFTAATFEGAAPEGWGLDPAANGLDEVLHCPEHRLDA